MRQTHYTVSYDISSDKQRRRVAKVLEKKGLRVQKSVFECRLSERQFLALRSALERLIDFRTDSLRYYPLCLRCSEAVVHVGQTVPLEETEAVKVI